jgi:hypothetical protein
LALDRKPKDAAARAKLPAAFLPKAEESKLGQILLETAVLLSMHNQTDAAKITLCSKQEGRGLMG